MRVSAAFFAPLIGIWPFSGLPPLIQMLSMRGLYDACRVTQATPMDKNEQDRLLHALAWMCVQYIGGVDGEGGYTQLDHQCMNAGEEAVRLLVKYGLLEPDGRGGRWTEKGRELLTRRV